MSGAGAMASDDLARFAEAIAERFGHHQEVSRNEELGALLTRRMQATRSRTFAAYRALLESGTTEWETLAPLLTVPETYFFRMPSHFDVLVTDVLPRVLAANQDTRTLRILSAGCATGEEPYTIRILLNERFPQLAHWTVEIVGVDLSAAALERARRGEYSAWSLRATSQPRRTANFLPVAKTKLHRLLPVARAGVVFRRENLLTAPPAAESPFDIVFCRNVLIYFTEDAIRTAIARIAERMAPGGYLFLGPAESLRGVSYAFQLCQGKDAFYYRLRTDAEPVPRAAALPAPPEDGGWYASIHESWQRLHRLVPGSADAVPATRLPAPPERLEEGALFSLLHAERFAQALDLLETLRITSGNEALRLERASILNSLGRTQEAEAEAAGLLGQDPADAGAHFLFGLCREQTGDLNGAVEHMTMATFLDPGFSMAHLHRGLIARRRHDAVSARTAFEFALRAIEDEDPRRITLFGGGFSRASLRQLCLRELSGRTPS